MRAWRADCPLSGNTPTLTLLGGACEGEVGSGWGPRLLGTDPSIPSVTGIREAQPLLVVAEMQNEL